MDWAPIISSVVAVLGGTGWYRWRRTARLRQELVEEVGLLNSLPEGSAKDALGEHVDRRVLLLVAEQEDWNTKERLNVRWSVGFIAAGLLFVVLFSTDPLTQANQWLRGFVLLIAIGSIATGTYWAMDTHAQRGQRRWAKRFRAEADASKPSTL